MATLLFLLLQAAAQPCIPESSPVDAPSLVVQAVDTLWLPLPGMEVTITASADSRAKHKGVTMSDGFAKFWLPRGAEYTVEVVSPGFEKKRVKDVLIGRIWKYTPTSYVQVQLQVASPKEPIE
jgi:hypothetical protein